MFPAGHENIAVRFVTLVTQMRVRILESGFSGDVGVVMLHGWAASAYSFRHELELLPALGAHCLAVDLRGFGLSDKPTARDTYTLDAYVADLDAVLDEVASPRVVLMGHSMGGGIALTYALSRPDRVRGLVLLSPTGIAPVAFLTIPRLMPRAVAARGGGLLVPRWGAKWILRNLAFAAGVGRRVRLAAAGSGAVGIAGAPEPGDTRPKGSSDTRRWRCRVTHSRRDGARAGRRSCPARGTARRDTSARRLILEPGAQHWLALSLIRS
jgi:pimeloyl-ACP methyl ester carboxylesterase